VTVPLPGGRAGAVTGDPLALFPLQTVLYPGGVLPLKVFEQRYVRLVTRCLAEHEPFGVCLLTRGAEVAAQGGLPVEFATVGTFARIDTCDVPETGILHVVVRGGTRFLVRGHEVAADGLVLAQVAPILPEPAVEVAPRHAPLVRFLELLAARIGPERLGPDVRYDDASWVGYRLAECLPLPLAIKQSMLEINDAAVRLEVLRQFLAKQNLL
jgi:uncharacterized protein